MSCRVKFNRLYFMSSYMGNYYVVVILHTSLTEWMTYCTFKSSSPGSAKAFLSPGLGWGLEA